MKKINKIRFAIIIAIDYELSNLNLNYETIKIHDQTYYLIHDEIILMFSGIGKVNASYKTALLIMNFNPQHIINIGSAGCCNPAVQILTVNIADKCQYGDVDVSCDPKYEINQIPYEPKYFYTHQPTLQWLNELLTGLDINVINQTAITIDSFVTQANKHHFYELQQNDVGSVDMESCAIAQVCHHYKTNFNCIKIVSDNIHHQSNHDEFNNNMHQIALTSKKIITSIVNSLMDKK